MALSGLDLIIHPKETFNNLKQAVANLKKHYKQWKFDKR